MDRMDYDELLNQYRSIWNNRLLQMNLPSKDILTDAILRELKDENSHPRIRRTKYEKFYMAVQRLQTSEISAKAKLQLIELHITLMEKLTENE